MSESVRPHRWQPTRLSCPWDSPGKNTGVGCHFLLQCMKVKSESEVAQSQPTLSDPMDCSLPGSSAHGIFQARVLERGAIAFSDCTVRAVHGTTVSKSGKKYIKAVCCHPAYLTYMQSTSWEMLGWLKHNLESRLMAEISVSSDMQMTPTLWWRVKKN